MKHSNSRNAAGFSIIEVLIAITMIGMITASVFVLQIASMTNVINYSKRLNALYSVRNLFFDTAFAKKEGKELPKEKEPEKADIAVTLKKIKPGKGSSLQKLTSLVIEQGQAQWQEGALNRKERLVRIMYEPEKKNE